jgi:hypothetical protein
MIDTDKYEGHLASEGQTWAWSKWMLKNAETIQQHEATAALLKDAPLLLAEVKRLRGILGDITAVDQWGGDGKDVGITITFDEGSYMGWLNKVDEVIE